MDLLTGPTPGPATPCSAAAEAVLRELARLLDGLAADPEAEATIDLRSLPLADADRAALRERLGRGEVEAVLDVAGATRVHETAFAGVWWVRHGETGDATAIEQIVVARIPVLLPAHPDDIGHAARRLRVAVEAAPTMEESAHE